MILIPKKKYFRLVVINGILIAAGLLSANGQAVTVSIDAGLETAGMLLETGKADSAAVLLFDILEQIEPKDREHRSEALYYLAMSMKNLGRLADQINYLLSARETGIDVVFADKIRFSYAEILLDTGNFDSCIGLLGEFREYLPASPLMPEMLYIAGNAYIAKQDYLRASNIFSEIGRSFPESHAAKEAVMKGGVCLYHLELINGAIQQLELYIAGNPLGENIRDALYYLGYAHMKRNDPLAAATSFKQLTLRYPNHPELLELSFLTGKMLFESGNFIEAENAFENFVYNTGENDANNEEARFYLERIMFRTGRYESEADIAEHFIAKYPNSKRAPKLLFDLARYYRARQMIDEALERYRVLINNPLYAAYADSAAVQTADTYYKNGMIDQARLFLAETAEASEDTTRIQLMYLKLGELNEKEERHDEAIAWYDRVLDMDSESDLSIRALMGIGRIFRSMSRWLEAAKTYERILADFPVRGESTETYLALAEIYYLQGNTYKAAETTEYAAALADSTEKWDIVFNAAEMYETIDEGRALGLYEELYENPDIPSHIRTRALMLFGDLSARYGRMADALGAFDRVIADAADSMTVVEAKRKVDDIRVAVPDSTRKKKF